MLGIAVTVKVHEMTKYAEIAAKAVDYADEFMTQRDRCEDIAHDLASKITAHLGAPEDAVQFLELDENLVAIWNPLQSAKLTQGKDGLWYCGLLITFNVAGRASFSKAALKFGMRWSPVEYSIRLDDEYTLTANDEQSWQPLLDAVVKGFYEYYSRPLGQPSKPIGFIVGS